MAGRRLIHGEAKAPVASQERAAFAGESRPALRACAAPPLEESEPGGGLELAEVAPEVPVRHAGARRRLADGAERVDEVEERGSTVAELDRLEDDPDLDLRFHAGGPGPSGPSLPMAQHPSGPADDTVIRPTWGPGRGGAPSRGHRGRGEIGSAGSSPHGRRAGMRRSMEGTPSPEGSAQMADRVIARRATAEPPAIRGAAFPPVVDCRRVRIAVSRGSGHVGDPYGRGGRGPWGTRICLFSRNTGVRHHMCKNCVHVW